VAHSILNRVRARKWWGRVVRPYPDHSIAAVCLKPLQYSCWSVDDPNSKLLTPLRTAGYAAVMADKTCRASLRALIDALDGLAPDTTDGATHYLTASLHMTKRAPLWSVGQPFVEIDGHRFFKGIA